MSDFTKPIPSNRMCFWYKGAAMNKEPAVAIVTSGDGNGILCLSIFGKQWSRHQCLAGIRHKDDPFLVKRPQHGKENGCWDYLPGYDPGAKSLITVPASAQKDIEAALHKGDGSIVSTPRPATPEEKDQIAKLAAEGKNSTEIAAALSALTNEHWSYQRINAILRQMQPSE